jgi:Uma2 family endonuclease
MNPVVALPEDSVASVGTDELLYEIVNGERRELPPMSAYESLIATVLTTLLGGFVRANNLGRPATETLFLIDRANRLQRRPDVAFISYQRWARNRPIPRTNAWEVVPDLMVEVISPTDLAVEVVAKVREYFQAGAQLVWVVFPAEQLVYVHSSPVRIQVLTREEELDGGSVVPGFRLPVAALFEDETVESAPAAES